MDRIPLLGGLAVILSALGALCRCQSESHVKGCRNRGVITTRRERHSLHSILLVLGGFGLRSATRTSKPAYWASWADCPASHPQHWSPNSKAVQHPFPKPQSRWCSCHRHGQERLPIKDLKTMNQAHGREEGSLYAVADVAVDFCGHHRAACAQAGMLGRRACSGEHHGAHLPQWQSTVADLRLSLTVCQSEVAHRWWWTPHRSVLCIERIPRRGAEKDGVALPLAPRKKESICLEVF